MFGEEVDDDAECKPKIGKSKPTEDEREDVVLVGSVNKGICTRESATHQRLDMEEKHADGVVTGPVEHKEIGQGVLSRGEDWSMPRRVVRAIRNTHN